MRLLHIVLPALLVPSAAGQAPWEPLVPTTWDEAALATLELPNAITGKPAKHVSRAIYDATPARTIYKTYPVYHPGYEPEGYQAWLATREPEIVFDPGDLVTKADWVAAGELVFKWPVRITPYDPDERFFLAQSMVPFGGKKTKDGVDPYSSFVIRERGRVEIGTMACATCHTRVMDDGSVILGAQGNSPFDRGFSTAARATPVSVMQNVWTLLYALPHSDRAEPPYPPDLTPAQMAEALAAIPLGVNARQGTSPFLPVQIADLIGVRNRRYLDRTGLVRHRTIGDLMRYAALNQGFDFLSSWDGYEPAKEGNDPRPDETLERSTDEQLYALALYLYALEPPANPNPPDAALVRLGKEVFERQRCDRCHTPPLYTSNQLTPARGFEVPEALRSSDDVRDKGVGTDPALTMRTRRGTGFYKVPSLLGVWYRGPFTHDGSMATLEDWFDPARLEHDYVPTGWNPGGKARAVRGHRFGLRLKAADRTALLAFLRSL